MYVLIHHSNKGVLMFPVLHTRSEYTDTTLYTLCIQSGRNM